MSKVHFGMSVGHLETEYTDTKCKQQPKIPGVRGKHIRIVLAPALIYGVPERATGRCDYGASDMVVRVDLR